MMKKVDNQVKSQVNRKANIPSEMWQFRKKRNKMSESLTNRKQKSRKKKRLTKCGYPKSNLEENWELECIKIGCYTLVFSLMNNMALLWKPSKKLQNIAQKILPNAKKV